MFEKELIITVRRRDGRVETRRVVVDKKVDGDQDGDLVTLWAFRLIGCHFARVARGASVTFSFTDLGGASRTQTCIGTASNIFLGSGCVDRAPYIGFGSSTIPPARADYVLRSELVRVVGSVYVDESVYEIRIVGSWTPDSGVSVCEVGLYMRVCDGGGVARFVLFDRSVLDSCVSVSAGDTISVSYVFRF